MNVQNYALDQTSHAESLSQNPLYGPYNDLLATGYLQIDTRIFSSVEVLNQHFYNILSIMQDGIETPQVQSMKVNVLFADGVSLNLAIPDYWFNLIFWELPVSAGDQITSKFLYFDESITKGTIKSYIDNNFIDIHRTDYEDMQMNNFIDNAIHKFMYIDLFSFYLMNTANNEDTIELMNSDQTFFDAIHCDLSNVPTEDIKNVGMDYTNQAIKEIIKSKDHWGRPYFMAGEGINVKQFREFMVNIGTVPDGEGGIYPYALNTNYSNGGVHEVKDYIVDASKARLSQEISHVNVGTSGAFARILGLNNTDTKLYPDPSFRCNSKNFVKIFVKNNQVLKSIKNRYYRFYEDGVEYCIGSHPDKTDKELIGKTILLRSPITCASHARGEGICYRCYGKLAHTNSNINIGRFAAEELSSQLTQRLLSAKHLLESSVKALRWPEEFSTFFDVDFGSIMISKEFTEKKYKFLINKDEIESEDEYDQSDYNEHISYCTIIDPNDQYIQIGTSDRDNLYISPAFSEMINKKKADVDGNVIFDIDDIRDMELFMVRVTNNELSLVLEKIKALLNRKAEVESLKTKEALVEHLIDTVNEGGLHVDTIHLEVLLSNQCVNAESNLLKPEWEYKDEPYKMITLNEALRDNPSVTISLMYEKIDKALYNPLTYKKDKPSSIDLFYMTHPQNYMSMECEDSGIISDKEGDMIKPFTMDLSKVK